MRVIQIPKKNKKEFRTIYVQNSGWERNKYRSYALILQDFFFTKPNNRVAHGFVPKRNCVTNAMEHVGKNYTLTVDLKSFFDYITPKSLIEAGVDSELAKGIMYDGRARQGLSSSPMAANIAASRIDDHIVLLIKQMEPNCVYTRYADDLTFSSDNINFLNKLKTMLPGIVKKYKFKVNHKKTRIQSSSYGRRIITGIAVDDTVHPTRANKRKLRALKHNYEKETNQKKKDAIQRIIVGLEEFTKCKLPNEEFKPSKMKLMMWNKHLALASDRILSPELLNRNYFKLEDRRRNLVNRIGIERCLDYLDTSVVETYGNYQLINVRIVKDGRWSNWNDRRYLKMQNPTLDNVFHIEGVHPDVRSIQQAINYRRYGDLNHKGFGDWSPNILT